MRIKVILLSLIIFSFGANAENINSDPYKSKIIEVRQNLGKSLNDAVKAIKDLLIERDDQLNSQTESLEELKTTADQIKTQTENPESNTTILAHGRSFMPKCGSDDELTWNGSSWKCDTPNVDLDCDPASTEYKKAKEDGDGYECYRDGTYEFEDGGLGKCNNTPGERYTVPVCMFDNSKTSIKPDYQVADSYCESKSIQLYEQACGPNGERSTCKCGPGRTYVYIGGEGLCEAGLTLTSMTSDMKASYADKVLQWGVKGDNYWAGTCKEFDRTMKFYNAGALNEMILSRIEWDDYVWLYINGKKVYTGPNKAPGGDWLGDYKKRATKLVEKPKKNPKDPDEEIEYEEVNINRFEVFGDKDNTYACERDTSWKKNPNIDLSEYIKVGTNELRVKVMVSGNGEFYAKFDVDFKDYRIAPPICKKQD